jgi:HSP90 family molecular chaperone
MDLVKDLRFFNTTFDKRRMGFSNYVDRMKEMQTGIYYDKMKLKERVYNLCMTELKGGDGTRQRKSNGIKEVDEASREWSGKEETTESGKDEEFHAILPNNLPIEALVR